MKQLKSLLYLQSSLLLLFLCACSATQKPASIPSATDPVEVQFAGFAYMGDYQHIDKNFPRSIGVNKIKLNGSSLFDSLLTEKIRTVKNPNMIFRINRLGELDNSMDNVALVFGLVSESTSVEKIGEYYKLVVEISAQALFFDFSSMSIVGSYPLIVQYIDLLPAPPTDERIQIIVKGIYTGQYSTDIFAEFANLLETVMISPIQGNFLQVSSVTVEDRAYSVLPKSLTENTLNLENFLAQEFSKYLSKNQQVSVLPYRAGYAVNNKMSARFSNGNAFNLITPEADYTIDLTLRGFKKVNDKQTSIGHSVIYGSYVNLVVQEPVTGKVYLDSNFKNASTKIIPSSQNIVDDWAAFRDSLSILFNKFTSEVSNPKSKWLKSSSGTKSISKNIKQFKQVIELCK